MKNIYGIESLVNAFENSLASSYYSQLKDIGTIGSKYIHYTSKVDNDTLTCSFELPGYGIEDINLDVEPGYITISSEKENKNFKQSFYISKEFDPETVSAEMKNGVLTLEYKRYKKYTPTRVKING